MGAGGQQHGLPAWAFSLETASEPAANRATASMEWKRNMTEISPLEQSGKRRHRARTGYLKLPIILGAGFQFATGGLGEKQKTGGMRRKYFIIDP
ncbi:hypothetical protein Pla144_01490 [Bythopirellula polymerisocia]|uniref:Uncharacterized protein n=1 Tax=Bythopirellula polymerisocia TaxID=2528003 RepID=A0A5C6CWN0_9BACT|nr:hypothetical protein Pla144_01490 [Bythopirellula polymerisocia]